MIAPMISWTCFLPLERDQIYSVRLCSAQSSVPVLQSRTRLCPSVMNGIGRGLRRVIVDPHAAEQRGEIKGTRQRLIDAA